MVDGGDQHQQMLATSTYLSIASKKEAKVFMGALEKKNFVTEAGGSTTLLDLPGTGHVRSALGQRLHIEPASHGALHSEGLEAVIVIIHQQPQETPTLPRLPREDIRLRLQLFLPIFIHVAFFITLLFFQISQIL